MTAAEGSGRLPAVNLRSSSVRVVGLSLLIALAAAAATAAGIFEKLENLAYDAALRLGAKHPKDPAVVVAAIDESSLERVGRWPWPRSRTAELIEAISAGGPAAIGIDIGFFEPDRERPAGDRALAEAVARAGNVVLPVYLAARPSLGEMVAFLDPYPGLAEAAAGRGHVHTEPSLDGITRKIYLRQEIAGESRWAFGLAAAAEFLRRTGREGRITAGEGGVRVGEIDIPSPARPFSPPGPEAGLIVQEYPLYIRFAGPGGTFLRLSAWEILQPGFPRKIFRDKIVLVGATAPGLGDLAMTPLSTERDPMPGVEIQANIVNTILSGQFVTRPPFAAAAALILILSLLSGRIFHRRSGRWGLLWLPVLLIAAAGLYLLLLLRFRIWLEVWPLLAVIAANYLAVSGSQLAFLFRSLDSEIGTLSRRERISSSPPAGEGSEESERFFSFLASLLGIDRALLLLGEGKGKTLTPVEAWGAADRSAPGTVNFPAEGFSGRPRQLGGPEAAEFFPGREIDPGSWLLLPLEAGEGKTGGLALGRGDGRPFSPEEEEIGRLAAFHLGQALRKAGEARRSGDGGKLPVDFFRQAGLERKIRILRFLSRSLADERSLLSAMLSAIADGVVVSDLLGSPLLLNRPARELLAELDERPERLRIIPFLSRLLNLPEGELAARARKIITAGETFAGEAEVGDRAYLVSLSAFRRGGGPAGGLMAVFTEITPLKKLDRLRAETMAMLSHEIARPISGIIGFCNLSDQGLVRPEEIGEYLELIRNAAAGLKELLADYLAVARLEAGAETIGREDLDPAGLIGETFRILAGRAAEKKIDLEEAIPSPAPELRGDVKLLGQVLENLVANAISYSPAGSTVTVALSRSGKRTVLRVTDRGPGVPEEEREKIFEKFYRGKQTRDIPGTGLGLAVSAEIVRRHGGEIIVSPREDGGTVFTVSLPVGEENPTS
ncbi:MAG: CHASE2 domain-containing protein [Candidatus Erginobacter occultus]|nr:CHASE2 domain-containing protein [Candidatus Erginobacter occultus]